MDRRQSEEWEYGGVPQWSTEVSAALEEVSGEEPEAWYRYIAETEAEGIWAIDEDGILTFVNRKFAAMLGEAPRALQGKALESWLAEPEAAALTAPQETGGYLQFRRRDGQLLHAVAVVTPLFDRQGKYRGTLGRVVDRTERQRQLTALREREARYRLLTEYATDIIALLTPGGELQYVSPAGTRLLGWTHLPGPLWRWVHPQDRRAVLLVWQVLQGQSLHSQLCFRFQKQDGSYLWLEVQFTGAIAEDGQKSGVVAVARDVTKRKEIEEIALQASERLHLALTGSGDGLWDWEWPDRLYLHPQSLAIVGLTDSLSPCAWLERVHPHYRVRLVQALYAHTAGEHPTWTMEYPIRHASGTWRWVQQKGKVVARDRRGRVLRLAGTLRDITDRKTSQRALQQQYKRELLLDKIVRDIRDQATGEQMFLRAAIAIGETFGVSGCAIYLRGEPQLTATCVAEFLTNPHHSMLGHRFPVAGNPAAVTLLTTDRVLAIANVSQNTELGTWQTDLRTFGVQSCLAVRTAERGRPTGLVVLHQIGYPRPWTTAEIALLQDVARHLSIAFAQADRLLREQRQNRALSQLKQQAEAASRAKSEFLAMMSHELRTPLNAVLGFTELMLLDTLVPKHREMLTLVQQSGQHLLRVLNDILAFTRADNEDSEPMLETFSPAVWVNETIAHWRLPAQERGSRVRVAVGATVPSWVRGDRSRLDQILGKLLDNAIKFGNGQAIEIALTWVEPNHLEVTVRDWGIGIAPTNFNKLFEPFVQADSSATRRYGGTGLGLAIATRLCRQLHGQLWVISGGQVGGHPPPDLKPEDVWAVVTGSQFGLRVAVLPAETACHPAVTPSSLQVLVVEDNPVNQRVLRRMLERLGHRTAVVGNGREALTWLQHHHCDLVLMDIHMPEMDGLEATRQIRRSQGQGQLHASLPSPLPIVAVTANNLAESQADCAAVGMTDYLGKPLTIGTLMACLEKYTGN